MVKGRLPVREVEKRKAKEEGVETLIFTFTQFVYRNYNKFTNETGLFYFPFILNQ